MRPILVSSHLEDLEAEGA